MEEVVSSGQSNEMLIGAIFPIDQVVDNHPQLAYRDYFIEVDHPVAGLYRYPGSPVFNTDGWWSIRRPAPMLGQHTEEILGEKNGSATGGSDKQVWLDFPDKSYDSKYRQSCGLPPAKTFVSRLQVLR